MKKALNSEKGFTLIELAIVLVIIGIILGAVLKGQDLMQNAKTKQFINKVKSWEIAQWTYYDRKGRFAGDLNKNGKIGDGNVKTDLIAAKYINPPYEGPTDAETNTISMGSMQFYVFYGTDGGANAGKNIMTVCKDAACANVFNDDELVFMESLDTALDGSSDGTVGQVIGTTSAPGTITAGEWEAVYASAPTPAAWGTTIKALVYYFDSKR